MTDYELLGGGKAAIRRAVDTANKLQQFVGAPSDRIVGRQVMGKNQIPTMGNMTDYELYQRSTPWYRWGEYSDPNATVGRVVFDDKLPGSQWAYIEATAQGGSDERVVARYTHDLGMTDGESRPLDDSSAKSLADTLTTLANEYYDGYAFAGTGEGLRVNSRETILGSAAFLGARDFNLEP